MFLPTVAEKLADLESMNVMANFTNHRDSQVGLRWDRFRATDHSALLIPMTRKDGPALEV